MAHFAKAAVTDEGNELLNEMMAGRFVRVTRAAGGTGTVEEEKLHEQTGLQDEKQALSIIDDTVDRQGRTISIQIGNAEESYPLEQIGVFGMLEGGGDEKLLFILQDDDPITVPDTGDPTFMLNIYAHLNINNVGRCSVTIDKTGIVNIEFLEKKLSTKQDTLTGNPGQLIGIGDDGITKATVYPCNRNIFINWYFKDPVNRLGKQVYEGVGYSKRVIDMWECTVSSGSTTYTFSLSDNGVSILSNGAVWFRQYFKNDIPWENGYTLLFLHFCQMVVHYNCIFTQRLKAIRHFDCLLLVILSWLLPNWNSGPLRPSLTGRVILGF